LVAHAAANVAFTVRMLDPPYLRVQVNFDGGVLFDVGSSEHAELRRFRTAPIHWQQFALAQCRDDSATPLASSKFELVKHLAVADPILDFQECALLVGSRVALVGELTRQADGSLVLQSCQSNEVINKRPRPTTPPRRSAAQRSLVTKVFVSNDPQLLSQGSGRLPSMNEN
jgi:hypothetical protein